MKIFSPILKGTTTVVQGTTNLSGSFTGSLLGTAATASYADNFTVGGTLTAQTINVQIITSSIEFNTGSTRNGALSTNTHQFTGSVLMTGSLTVVSKVNIHNDRNYIGRGEIRLTSPTNNANVLDIQLNDTTTYISGNYYGGGSDNTIIIGTYANNTNQLVLKPSGQVGIGTTFIPYGTVAIKSNSTTAYHGLNVFATGNGNFTYVNHDNNVGIIGTEFGTGGTGHTPLTFQAGGSERMRISTAGSVGIGTTSPNNRLEIRNDVNGDLAFWINNRATTASGTSNSIIFGGYRDAESSYVVGKISLLHSGGSSGDLNHAGDMVFYTQQANPSSLPERMRITSGGSIGAAGSTTNIYNASDARLKQNITPITYGLDAVSSLNPVKFNWANGFEPIEADKILLGFIAQEVQEVIPEAIESFNGEMNLNGTVITDVLRVNEKFIIPVLVKAIQELKSENDTLKEILQRNNIQ